MGHLAWINDFNAVPLETWLVGFGRVCDIIALDW